MAYAIAFKLHKYKKGIELSNCNSVVKMIRSMLMSLLQTLIDIYPSQS